MGNRRVTEATMAMSFTCEVDRDFLMPGLDANLTKPNHSNFPDL